MLGICFFTQRGEYTGELVWEGEKGVGLVGRRETFRVVSGGTWFQYKKNLRA